MRNKTPFTLAAPKFWRKKLWSPIASERVELERHWRYPPNRKTALAHFEVDRAHLWLDCDVVSGENRFFTYATEPSCVHSVGYKPKPNMLETKFLHHKVCEDLTCAMMIKKVETSFGGGPKTLNHENSGVLWGSSHFCASQNPPTPPNLQKRWIWVFCNIPPNFKPKYWQENCIPE